MRIGLFGGTFNPIHEGHLHVAREVLRRLDLDRVLFIPASVPPHKAQALIPSSCHRLEMIRRAIEGTANFYLSDIEVKRGGISYSVETISQLKQDDPQAEFFFIMGMDAFIGMPTWKEAERILTLCHFIIVSRVGSPFSGCPALSVLRGINLHRLRKLDQGEIESYTFSTGGTSNIYFLHLPPDPTSASGIRSQLALAGVERNLLPDPVVSYIIENGLYLRGDTSGDTTREFS